MSNDFYNHGSYPTPNSPGSSALLRAELDLIAAGFDKLPTLTSNANKLVAVNSTGTGLTVVSTLPSLDVIDSTFIIQDNADSTKKVRFEASGVTTGTTRVLTVPNADTTLVGTDATQTLTNKTLTSPTVSGGTINNAVIGGTTPAAGTFTSLTASSGTISGSAIATADNTLTLTNKTLTSPQINNGFMNGGSIDNVTIGSGTPASGTFTTMAATAGTIGGANIVTVSATQTLTNKTLTSPVVSGGTVDNAPIGATTPSTGAFTTLSSSSLTVGGVAVVTLSGMQTLTNKTISGSSNTISNIANASLVNSSVTIGSNSVSLGGTLTTIAGLTLTSPTINSPTIASITNVGTLTLPTSTDTLVGRATTDTLTNKTMSGASNTFSNIPNTAITGLGTMSTQNATSVAITGGSIAGITDLAVADGGTGASTAAAARVNLLPSYSTNALKVLRVNSGGTDVEWATVAAGSVTSVDISSSDLSVTGGPITSSGTFTLTLNTVPVSKGGTNATTAAGARTNLLPSFTGNAGKVLAVNAGGTDVEYITVGGTGTVTSIATGTGLTGGPITASGTISVDTAVVATTTNTLTMTNKTLTSPVISGGTVDNAVIGGTTAAAGSFTTLNSNSTTSLGATTASSLTSSGNLTLSTTGARIIGDFSNSLHALRAMFQTSTANSSTQVGLIPSGTGTISRLNVYNGSDPDNSAFGQLAAVGATDVRLSAGIQGTGSYLPLTVYTGGSERARVDTSGNVVVGTAQLADSATNGFLYIPGTTTGAPSGSPTAYTGRHPMVYDGTNKVLYLHDGTSWVAEVGLTATQTLTNKTLGSGTVITAGTINGVTIGGSNPGEGTFTNFVATGNVLLGDATTDTLSIGGNAITWTGTPVHSSNHTFSGSVTVNGNTVLGDASGDTLTIAPNAVTWSNNPTHSGNHAFSGTVAHYAATTFLASSTTTQDGITLNGRAGGTSSYRVTLTPGTLTASRAVTFPDAAGALVLDSATQTLTNKTLTAPVISTISNTGTLTLPTSTDTLVGRATADTLSNKTLVDPTITGTILEDIYTIVDGAAFEIDPGNGSIQLITLGASRTPKATNFANGEAVTLMVDDGTAYTLTWTDATFGGSGVVWKTDSGSAPTLNTSGYTAIVLWKVGGQVYGARVGNA